MKKTFYFFALFFIAITALKAQAPANDLCSGAQAVTPNGNCYAGTTTGSADNWVGTVGCQSANHAEVWYSFTATGSQLSVSVTPGTIGGTIEFILVQATAPCTGLSIVGSLCGSSPLTGTINGLQAGNLYYYTISSTGSAGTFTTCVNNTTPPPVAGQDCASSAILCSSATFSQSTSAAGFGTQEVSNLNSCWGSGGERQSKWFKFTVGCSGTLEFNINPITNSNDYDWALWNVTAAGCPTSTNSLQSSIACNWSGCKGSTGLSSCPNSEPGVVTSGAGCGGGPAAWSTPINVTAGQTYALLVDNFSTSNTGFNLIFGGACNGGTALIGPSATFTFTSPSCGAFNFTKSCPTTNSTFFWNFGDGTTSTLQNPSHTYTVSGNFIVTLQVTDALGCTVTSSQTMTVGIPTSNAGPDLVLCSTATGTIGAAITAGYTYSWSPSTGLGSTTVSNPSFTLTNTGVSAAITVYTVTTSSSGCTSTDAVSITVNPSPTVTAGPTQSLTCSNTSTVLSGTSSGGAITWSGPGITGGGSTTTPTVNATGIYTISVTNAGCTNTATVTVGQNTVAPTVTATTSNSLNCTVISASVVVSTTTSPASYTWTGTGITAGAGTATAAVNAGGTFNYTVTNPGNGCKTTGTVAVIQNTTAPAVTAAASSSLNCQTTSTTVVATTTTTPVSYAWAGPGIIGGGATASPTVNAGGTYNYTVINTSNNCATTGTVAVVQNNTIPAVTASTSGSLNCVTTTVQTIATTTATPVSYTWTGTGITAGANSVSATVNAGGLYNYTVTNTFNQCSAVGSVSVTQNITVPSVTAVANGSLNCLITSTTIAASTTASPVSYNWAGPGITAGANSATATVNAGGNYIYTVTNTSNSCTANGTVSVIQNTTAPAVIAAASSSLNCQITSTTIVATTTTSPASYTWTGTGITAGANTASATVNAGGTFNYTVTNPGNGCFTAGSVSVTQNNTVPPVTAAPNGSINCTTATAQAVVTTTASPVSYTWSGAGIVSGANTASATVNAGGNYGYTVTNTFNQCMATGTVTIIQSAGVPSVTASSGSLNCNITSTTVVASTTASPVSYTWTGPGITSGANTATATINLGGNYIYTVTNTSNSCTATGTVSVVQNTTSPVVNATASSSLNCQVTSTTVVASTTSSPVSYTWTGPGITGGANSASATVNSGGTYNYTVTNSGNNCSTTGTLSVVQNNTLPVISATTSGSLNCATTTVQTIATTTASPVSYTWTGPGIIAGANSASATVNAGGTYNYTVANTFNQCVATGSIGMAQSVANPTVTAAANGSLNCQVTSTTIAATTTASPVTYTWSGPGITAGSGSSIATVNLGGNYVYTVTNTSNSCTATGTVSVIQNTTAPSPTASTPGTITCSTTTVNLNGGPSSLTYTWVAPPGSSVSSANQATTTGTGGGTYTLSVTNPSTSCNNSITLVVPTQTTNPIANIINNPTITCTNTLVTISGSPSSGVSYTWTGAGISGPATNSNVNVTATGVYTLAVTSTSNGCTSAPATVTISANTASPSITMGSNPTIPCLPPTVQITATVSPATATVNWTGPNVCGGANSPTASACTPGIYTLTATDPSNGCSSVSTLTVDPNAGLNVNVANTGTIYCNPSTVQVVASATPATNNTYSWSGPGIVSGNGTSSVTVNQGGTYSVVVTNTPSGCSFSFTNTVQADNIPLNIAATTNSVDCITTSANITTTVTPASGSLTYSWSNSASTPGISVSPTVTTSYVVTVTNTANGCTGSQTVSVIADTTPPTGVSVGPNNFTLTCLNTSTVLTGAATGAATYSWASSIGSFTSPSTPTLNVSSAGTYTFIAIGANGCFATDVATVSPNSSAPVFSLTNSSPTITCGPAPTVSIIVTSTATVSYSWSPALGISGSNTLSTVTFTAAGTYTADVTDNNGCASSSVISVASATTPPTLTAGTDTAQPITCTNTITTLSPAFTPPADLTYTWTGAGIVGSAFTNPIQVSQSGNYSVTVTNSVTGCSTSVTIAVIGSTVIPTLTVTSSSSIGISCQPGTNTVTLNAQTGGSVTYTWSTGNTNSSITSSLAGTYSITVTDINSGCTASASIVVPDNSIPPSVNVLSAGDLACGGGTTSLSALSSNTNVSYSWSGAGIVSGSLSSNAIVNQPGSYSVTAIDLITGCSATNTLSVAQLSLSAIAAADATTGTAPLNVNFTNQGTGATTYTWSFGDGNSSMAFNTSNTYVNTGTYTVVLNVSNGSCISSDTLLIKVFESLGEIPEIFTPNGDGKNDVFFIPGLDSYPGSNLQVFNRWGNLVYSSKPYKNDWDGSPNAAGKTGSGKLPGGTYYYLLELGDANNTVFKGYVQLQY